MVILDEKALMLPPPPPYLAAGLVSPPPFPANNRVPPTLVTLPQHLLLRIVYETFAEGRVEKQRKVLYWLTMSLRLVNRAMYIACMHVLRSSYLPSYAALIRSPYTSDPFPHVASASTPAQRETRVLDLFIALKVREDVWADESELHLEREESFKDLFDLMQPRARLEDLVRIYGVRDGAVAVPLPSGATPVSTSSPTTSSFSSQLKTPLQGGGAFGSGSGKGRDPAWYQFSPLPFAALTISYSPRAVGLVMTTRERKRKIVEVSRTREETLEVSAKKLVKELRSWIALNPSHGVR